VYVGLRTPCEPLQATITGVQTRFTGQQTRCGNGLFTRPLISFSQWGQAVVDNQGPAESDTRDYKSRREGDHPAQPTPSLQRQMAEPRPRIEYGDIDQSQLGASGVGPGLKAAGNVRD
jgi:hypothetical protein